MSVTIKDVAREAGVSISTVSKVLNHWPTISQQTVQRVEAVMKQLDYAPNNRAASLARRTTRNIVYLTSLAPDAAYNNPHMFDIMCGVQSALDKHGYSLTLVNTAAEEQPGVTAERIIMQKLADGMVIHGTAINKYISSLLIRRDFPHIIIGHPHYDNRLCWVDTNNVLGGQLAAEHLFERGYQRIGFLGGRENDEISNLRLQGFRMAMQEQGYAVNEDWIMHSADDLEGSYTGAFSLLQRQDTPDAVICSSNLMAFGFQRVAETLHVRVPEQIAMITFDKYPYSAVIDPSPTLVHINVYDMGCEAGKMLLRELKNPGLQVQSYTTLPQVLCRATTPYRLPHAQGGSAL
jgi:LacI family transcriptional regulator